MMIVAVAVNWSLMWGEFTTGALLAYPDMLPLLLTDDLKSAHQRQKQRYVRKSVHKGADGVQ